MEQQWEILCTFFVIVVLTWNMFKQYKVNSPRTNMRRCDVCHVISSTLHSCSRCHVMSYCSKRCQTIDWNEHKEHCSNLASREHTAKKYEEHASGGKDLPRGKIQASVSGRKTPSERSACHWCQNVSDESRRCSRCKEVTYCSQSCQRKDWKENHRKFCQPADTAAVSLEEERPGGVGIAMPSTEKAAHPGRSSSDGLDGDTAVCRWCQDVVDTPRTCSKCGQAVYCSRSCQKKDWKDNHKVVCEIIKTGKDVDTGTSIYRSPEIHARNIMTATDVVLFCYWCQDALSSPLRCAGCMKAVYCSKACQTEDWKARHKTVCKSGKQGQDRTTDPDPPQDPTRDASPDPGSGSPAIQFRDVRETGSDPGSEPLRKSVPMCKACGSQPGGLKSCVRCKDVSYCSKTCQREDWPRHKPECVSVDGVIHTKEYKRKTKEDESERHSEDRQNRNSRSQNVLEYFLSTKTRMMAGVDLGVVQPRLTWPEAKLAVQTKYPGSEVVEVFENLPCELLWMTPVTRGRVLMATISGMHPHLFRHAVYIKDGEGNVSFVMFYVGHADPTPFFSWRQLQPGNYICIENAVFHNFMDGSVGFRVNDASSVKIF